MPWESISYCLQGTVEEESRKGKNRKPTKNNQIKRERIKSDMVCEIENEVKGLLTKLFVYVNQHFLGGHVGPSEIDSAGFTLGRPLGAT